MSQQRRRPWPLGGRFADWIDARIRNALSDFVKKIDIESAATSHRIETRAQLATLESMEKLRGLVAYEAESRAQMAGREAKAYADAGLDALSGLTTAAISRHVDRINHEAESRAQIAAQAAKTYVDARLDEFSGSIIAAIAQQRDHTAHEAESRTQIAVLEAKAYADAGLQSVSNSLEIANRNIADSSERLRSSENTFSQVSQRLEAVNIALGQSLDQLADQFKESIQKLSSTLDGAISNYDEHFRNTWQRVEFIRSETMFELQSSLVKASVRKAVDDNNTTFNARIVNAPKVTESKKTGLRLNVGCGHIQPEGFVNVDAREVPGIDIVSEATNIPLEAGIVAEVFSAHLIEHFSENILHRVLLPHWYDLLEDGGVLTTIAPDGAAMMEAVTKGDMSFEDFREVLFGSQDYDGDFHYNLITPDSYYKSLERSGFIVIETEYSGKRNGKCFEFKITARKPQKV